MRLILLPCKLNFIKPNNINPFFRNRLYPPMANIGFNYIFQLKKKTNYSTGLQMLAADSQLIWGDVCFYS